MSARQLVETSSRLIRDCIKANIAAELAALRTDRSDNSVGTEIPQNYFFYENANVYRSPAIFIIADTMDFRKTEMGANHINARTLYKVSAVIEDRSEDYLTIKAWRYQAVLHEILDQTELEDTVENVKIVITVSEATFSPTFTTSGTQPNNFRKEVLLNCEVYHFENF